MAKNTEITVSDVARLFNVKVDIIKKWGKIFSEYLSPTATQKGKTRKYTQTDIQVLALINDYWDWEHDENDGDHSGIIYALETREYFEERYLRIAYFNTPVFQELPEGLDATWTHGMLFGGMSVSDWIYVAQSFRLSGDILRAHTRSCLLCA
jgi:hypothetical protein